METPRDTSGSRSGETAPGPGRAGAHRIFELAPGILVVFKPAGHAEKTHDHPAAQEVRLLTGRLRIRLGRRTVLLAPGDAFTIPAGRPHATLALEGGWALVIRHPTEDRRGGRRASPRDHPASIRR